MRANMETVEKNNWRVYPSQKKKVQVKAKKSKVSESSIIRSLIDNNL